MTFLSHIKKRQDIYILFGIWAMVGFTMPIFVASAFAILTFLLVLRTEDLTKVIITFIAILVLSDSRSRMFAFAETAKIAIVLLLFVFVLFNWKKFNQNSNKVFINFLPFLVYAVLCTLWSVDPYMAFQKSLSYGLIFFMVPVVFLQGAKENGFLQVELVYFFTVVLALGLIIHLINPSFSSLVGRYRGLLGNPNGLGILLTVIFGLYYPTRKVFSGISESKRFQYFFVFVFFISLVLSGSRTALVALAIFFIFKRFRYLSNTFLVGMFLAIVILYDYLLLQLPFVIGFLGLEEYLRVDTIEEGSGRFVAWNFAWEKIQNVFFIGGGFTFTEYTFHMFSDELSRLGHQGNAHNSYLTLWLDTGLIGILLLAFGLIRTIIAIIKNVSYALPIVFLLLFSTYFESWLAGSLNPIMSNFLIVITVLLGIGNNREFQISNASDET